MSQIIENGKFHKINYSSPILNLKLCLLQDISEIISQSCLLFYFVSQFEVVVCFLQPNFIPTRCLLLLALHSLRACELTRSLVTTFSITYFFLRRSLFKIVSRRKKNRWKWKTHQVSGGIIHYYCKISVVVMDGDVSSIGTWYSKQEIHGEMFVLQTCN